MASSTNEPAAKVRDPPRVANPRPSSPHNERLLEENNITQLPSDNQHQHHMEALIRLKADSHSTRAEKFVLVPPAARTRTNVFVLMKYESSLRSVGT